MTPLDQALEESRRTKNEAVFYNAFLNARLYLPLADAATQAEGGRAGSEDRISPILIEADGQRYLMLFDTRERLAAWARREVPVAALPGHAIVAMMSPDHPWMLNAGTEHPKSFVSDEIRWLKRQMSAGSQAGSVAAGTRIRIEAPVEAPGELVEALEKRLARDNPEVEAAYLARVLHEQAGDAPHLALVLDIDSQDRQVIDAIVQDVMVAIRPAIGPGEPVDLMVNAGKGIAFEITRIAEPVYRRTDR